MDLAKTLKRLEHGTYRNTNTMVLGGIEYTMRELLIKAPLLAGLNVYLVGGTGEGKSELAHDLIRSFGDDSCYMMGRPDFEPQELLRQINLGDLKTATSDQEIISLTDRVQKLLFYADELNRAPPVVQNYFFDFMDGKVVHQGRIYPLGRRGYSVGYASGNLGNGEYVGVSDTDRALLDRMHMIVKLDHPDFTTTPEDDDTILSGKKDPRASAPTTGDGSISKAIVEANSLLREREVDTVLPLLGLFLHKGLDYVAASTRNSKRALGPRWARAEGVRQDTYEGQIYPLSKRAILSAIALTSALEMIGEAKGAEPYSPSLFLDGLRLIVPYSGVINPSFIDNLHGGDVYTAYHELLGPDQDETGSANLRGQIDRRLETLETAALFASAGDRDEQLLEQLVDGDEAWRPVADALVRRAEIAKENPSPHGLQAKAFIDRLREENNG